MDSFLKFYVLTWHEKLGDLSNINNFTESVRKNLMMMDMIQKKSRQEIDKYILQVLLNTGE